MNRGFLPKRAQSHNASVFILQDLDRWTYENQVIPDHSTPEKLPNYLCRIVQQQWQKRMFN